MVKKAVIAGGTGFIGTYLKEKYERLGYRVYIISRQSAHIQWDDTHSMKDALDGAKLVINLAGKSVNCRYTESNKREIFNSRTETTEAILTERQTTADRFFERLDSAILMHNASTQFADGGEFGMGAEIGIATGKLHARGPVGAEQLTSFKYLVTGDGTIRA